MSTITETEAAGVKEDEIKLALLGDELERNKAFSFLYDEYSERLVGYLESKLPGLPLDLAANAMVDAFRAMNDQVIAGTFDYDQPLAGFLFGVVWNKGVDELRKFSCRALGKSEFYDAVGESLEETDVGRKWSNHVQASDADALAQEFRDFLVTLPEVQRQVAQVMADNFPSAVAEAQICEEVFHRPKSRMTVVQVKSAKREIRRKFKETLNK